LLEGSKDFPLFLLAAAKSALRNLTVKCRVFSDFSELSDEKFKALLDSLVLQQFIYGGQLVK